MNQIFNTDCLSGMQNLPEKSVNCCVTSPPYYGLRDYGHAGQFGLEETPEKYVSKLVELFAEVKRVLRDDGTLWLNLGDSYANPSKPGGGDPTIGKRNIGKSEYRSNMPKGLKPKDLIGIPWMVAFALRADGWYLRQDIIWHKPNPMPESVTDRCTKSHEYIFLMSKGAKYYYDADSIKTPLADASIPRLMQDIVNQKGSDRVPGKTNGNIKAACSFVKGYEGNCKTCWKKSFRKLVTIYRHNPHWFAFLRQMEIEFENFVRDSQKHRIKLPVRFFRDNKTVADIAEMAKDKSIKNAIDDSRNINYQKSLWHDGTELDISNGCSESCEVFTS